MNALVDRLQGLQEQLEARYARLSFQGRLALWVWAGINAAFFVFMLYIGPERMFQQLSSWADALRDAPYGWLFLIVAIILTSIPPLFGYSTCMTLCGFAFGLKGWFIAAIGAMLGAAVSFVICRRAVRRFAPYIEHEPAFQGLAAAVRSKGTKLCILIRLCPLPYGYSNAFFASIESVSLAQFLLATLVITPKLLLYVWIGERTYLFADPASRQRMDPAAKVVNALSIAFGSIIGAFTGWYIWRLVQRDIDPSAAYDPDLADESQLYAAGGGDDEDDDDVDAIERRLVDEGHISKEHLNGEVRPSTDRWDDNFSDFADDPHDRSPAIDMPTPIAEEPDPLRAH